MDIEKFNKSLPEITKEQIETGLISDVSKKNFFELIEIAKNAVIDKATIKATYPTFASLRELYLFLEATEDDHTEMLKELLKAIKAGFDVYKKPIKKLLEEAEPRLIKANAEIKKDEKEKLAAIVKHNAIRQEHIDFVKGIVKKIVSCNDSRELGRIQQSIGTEKSRAKFYGDHHEKVVATCDLLLKLVDQRKDIIKENASLVSQMNAAGESKDYPLQVQLKERIDVNQRTIEEHAEVIADHAFSEITGIPLMKEEIISEAVIPRTHRWSWRIADAHLLYKKMPELVTIEGKPKDIKAFMDSKEGELIEDADNVFHGLVLYRKPFFVEISK